MNSIIRFACKAIKTKKNIRMCSNKPLFSLSLEESYAKRPSFYGSLATKDLICEKDIESYKKSADLRKLSIDFKEYNKLYMSVKTARKNRNEVGTKVTAMKRKLNKFESTSTPEFLNSIKELQKQYKILKDKFIAIFRFVKYSEFRLPNFIHYTTPSVNKIIYTYSIKPFFENFKPKCHSVIGIYHSNLVFYDNVPILYYLKEPLQRIEEACSNLFMESFENDNYTEISNPNVFLGLVPERCCIDYKDLNEIIQLNFDSDDGVCLTGSSSLVAFTSYFFNREVENFKAISPLKFVTRGKKYNVNFSDKKSLFNTCQSTSVDAFILCTNDDNAMLKEYDIVFKNLIKTYESIGLHFICIKYSPPNLHSYESAATGFLMFSPSCEKYIEVGRISICEDFISKRVHSKYYCKINNNLNFTSAIYVQSIDITKWIGLLIENTQKEDLTYFIPNVIKSKLDIDK